MNHGNLKLYPIYLSGLMLMSAAAWLLTPIFGGIHWLFGISGALALCLLAVLCHAKAEGRTVRYIIGYILNGLGSGCAIGTLYAEMEWIVNVQSLALALVPSVVLALLLCLGYLGQGKLWRKVWGISILLLAVATVVFSIFTWIKWDRVIGSFCFFSSICLLFFLMACLFTLDKPEGRWRYLSFSGFWAFAVIAIVVVLILSEGEALDGLDFGGSSGKKKKAKRMGGMK